MPLCSISGSTGETVDCAVNVAAHAGTPTAGALNFNALYDDTVATFANTSCLGSSPFDKCKLLGQLWSGHSISINDGSGLLQFLLWMTADPLPEMSDAIYDDGAISSGDAWVFNIQFTLNQDVPASDPLKIYAENMDAVGTDSNGSTLQVEVLHDGITVLVTSLMP